LSKSFPHPGDEFDRARNLKQRGVIWQSLDQINNQFFVAHALKAGTPPRQKQFFAASIAPPLVTFIRESTRGDGENSL
jgi:hypothetical protein